jgi:hypothetical protein
MMLYILRLLWRAVVHPLDTLLGPPDPFENVPDTTPSSPPPRI